MCVLKQADKEILRELAKEYAEIAALPIHEEKKKLWIKLNGLQRIRPMVMLDQVCWNEMDHNGELTNRCEDSFLRSLESFFRRNLYQWEHFPVDKVFDPWINVPKAISNTGFGVQINEETVVFEAGSVLSHKYENLFQTDEDLEKIQVPQINHDKAETEKRLAKAHEIFDGILEVRSTGMAPYLSLWDPISMWMSVEDALFAMIDKPEFMHKLLRRMTDGYLDMLDQLEDQGLLSGQQSVIHCTGAFTDELPAKGYNPETPRCMDLWMFGLAQMLGIVSPAMYDEFEIQYTSLICERFGLVYYGCCEPLDKKIEQVRKLPNVRKISMSPWADHENGAAEIGRDFVFSSKPNPAHLATSTFDDDLIRCELTKIKQACDRNNSPLEFILKDISTVCHKPERLDKWAKIAMEVAEN
ncbi:MAG: hypothetical protein GXP32_03110 [Kiritimatiellaeota bacterium]|nr:hypothetical protein [Kiritimatiellota bacterium]